MSSYSFSELRAVFAHMRKVVHTRWPGDQTVESLVIRFARLIANYVRMSSKLTLPSNSCFIFLRFFNPAILNPKLFNMMSGARNA